MFRRHYNVGMCDCGAEELIGFVQLFEDYSASSCFKNADNLQLEFRLEW